MKALDKKTFLSALEDHGFFIVQNMLSEHFIEKLKSELKVAIYKEAKFHKTKNYRDYGMLLACPIYGGAFLELLDNRNLIAPFNWVLGETCIVYVYPSSSMPPKSTNHSNRIHVDRPILIPGFIESLGCLILLDDFTEENGATYYLPGSHKTAEKPEEVFFYKNAQRLIAPKGSVFYFNPRIWHSGGENNSNEWRHAIALGMVRPYLKQRLDLPRAMKDTDLTNVSDFVLQKLGFFAQTPSSLEEFYAPLEDRPYRQPSEYS